MQAAAPFPPCWAIVANTLSRLTMDSSAHSPPATACGSVDVAAGVHDAATMAVTGTNKINHRNFFTGSSSPRSPQIVAGERSSTGAGREGHRADPGDPERQRGHHGRNRRRPAEQLERVDARRLQRSGAERRDPVADLVARDDA